MKKQKDVIITERDSQIIKQIYYAKLMSVPQIQAQYWTGSGKFGPLKMCQSRIKALTDNGYLRRVEPYVRRNETYKPYLYAVGIRSMPILEEEWHIKTKPEDFAPNSYHNSYDHTRHILAPTDILLAIKRGIVQTQTILDAWMYEKEIKQRLKKEDEVKVIDPATNTSRTTYVVPDSAFALIFTKAKLEFLQRSVYFLEIDMGPEPIYSSDWNRTFWDKKVRAYLAYYTKQTYQAVLKGTYSPVLVVTVSVTRMEHMRQAAERLNGGELFWFTTLERITNPQVNMLTAPLWVTAADTTLRSLISPDEVWGQAPPGSYAAYLNQVGYLNGSGGN